MHILGWLKNRFTDLKYFSWLAKKRYFLPHFLVYWILYPIPRLLLGRKKAPDVSGRIISYFKDKNLIIPLPINNPCYIGLRDAVDFNAFREVCIEDHYNFSQLKLGMIIVDIGAHIGTFTLLASKIVGEQGKVIAIEPEVHNFEQLKRNLELNRIKNVVPVNVALSDFNDKKDFFITKGSGCHSFSPMPGEKIIDKIQVNVKTLDTLLQELNISKIDLIKIDAEGAEISVLKGAEKTLRANPHIKIIVAAEHYPSQVEEVCSFLNKKAFKTKILKDNIVAIV